MLLVMALVLLILGTPFGFNILTAILKNKHTPKSKVIYHTILETTGFIFLLIAVLIGQRNPLVLISLALFIISAIFGFMVLYIDYLKKPIPKLLAILHAIFGFMALVILGASLLPLFATGLLAPEIH
jgi:hypothetical protein